jgi:hypothetical protein
MPSSSSAVSFSKVSSTSVRATLSTSRTVTLCFESLSAVSRSFCCPGFFARNSPRPRTGSSAGSAPSPTPPPAARSDSVQLSASATAAEGTTRSGVFGPTRPSSPARTRSRAPRASRSTISPRVTATRAPSPEASTANLVPTTSISPPGTATRARGAPSTCATSATIAPRVRRSDRGPSSRRASSASRSTAKVEPSPSPSSTRVRPSVRTSQPGLTLAPLSMGLHDEPSARQYVSPPEPPSARATTRTSASPLARAPGSVRLLCTNRRAMAAASEAARPTSGTRNSRAHARSARDRALPGRAGAFAGAGGGAGEFAVGMSGVTGPAVRPDELT